MSKGKVLIDNDSSLDFDTLRMVVRAALAAELDVYIDAAGFGEGLIWRLRDEGLRVSGFVFTFSHGITDERGTPLFGRDEPGLHGAI